MASTSHTQDIIYTTPNCPNCRTLTASMEREGIAFKERDLSEVRQFNAGLEVEVAERTAAPTRQEAFFRALAEQVPEVVWKSDAVGHLTYVNRRLFELMGGVAEDWLGAKWFEAVHPNDRADITSNWKRSLQSGAPYTGIRRLLGQDGAYHTMSYRASPVLDKKGAIDYWVGIETDITEVKAIEHELRLSNQELETFSYSVSHDLRSPLNTVAGISSLLAHHLGGGADDKAQHYLARIQTGVMQMEQLIEGLLALAQVSRVALRRDAVDLSELSRDILERCQARDPGRQVTVRIEGGLTAQGDGPLLRAAMDNLLGNAWKFSSRQPQADITVGRREADGVFYVKDNGAGFDMAYADKLFGTFQRLHAMAEYPGTGIGLATVSRIIMRHGGKIWAESAPGQGATFLFTLPQGGSGDSVFAPL